MRETEYPDASHCPCVLMVAADSLNLNRRLVVASKSRWVWITGEKDGCNCGLSQGYYRMYVKRPTKDVKKCGCIFFLGPMIESFCADDFEKFLPASLRLKPGECRRIKITIGDE